MPIETIERTKSNVDVTPKESSGFKITTSLHFADLQKEDLKEIELVKESNATNKCNGECNAGCRGGGGKHCGVAATLELVKNK